MEKMNEPEGEKPNQTNDDDHARRAGGDAATKEVAGHNCGNESVELPGDFDVSVGNPDATLAGDSTKVGKP
jgi:hypothetical protein